MAASTPTLASDEARPAAGRTAGSPRERLARFGLVGITVLALAAFAVYAAHLASRVDEVVVGDPVPISVPGGGTVSGPFGTGVPAPDFSLQTADGKTVQLSDFAGRPVWINIWAS